MIWTEGELKPDQILLTLGENYKDAVVHETLTSSFCL